jgi:hypothetical protein
MSTSSILMIACVLLVFFLVSLVGYSLDTEPNMCGLQALVSAEFQAHSMGLHQARSELGCGNDSDFASDCSVTVTGHALTTVEASYGPQAPVAVFEIRGRS